MRTKRLFENDDVTGDIRVKFPPTANPKCTVIAADVGLTGKHLMRFLACRTNILTWNIVFHLIVLVIRILNHHPSLTVSPLLKKDTSKKPLCDLAVRVDALNSNICPPGFRRLEITAKLSKYNEIPQTQLYLKSIKKLSTLRTQST